MDYNLIQNTDYENHKHEFWTVNPEFKYVNPYDKLYNKGHNEEETSKIMWAIFLYCDLKSPKYRLRQSERLEDILKYFIENEKLDFLERYQEYIEAYPKVVLTKIQRELKSWADKIEERNIFIESNKYGSRNFEMLDKMMKDSKFIWESFDKIKSKYDDENIKTRARGGREESFLEKKINNKEKK